MHSRIGINVEKSKKNINKKVMRRNPNKTIIYNIDDEDDEDHKFFKSFNHASFDVNDYFEPHDENCCEEETHKCCIRKYLDEKNVSPKKVAVVSGAMIGTIAGLSIATLLLRKTIK